MLKEQYLKFFESIKKHKCTETIVTLNKGKLLKKILIWSFQSIALALIISLLSGVMLHTWIVPLIVDRVTVPQVRIIEAQFSCDENLLDEWVKIRNKESNSIDMSGWKLTDEGDRFTFSFPDGFKLRAGAIVIIHTMEGIDTYTDLYWNRNGAVWNDDGDTASLEDENGKLIDSWCNR